MKQVVWITGASSGIGAALVRQYCNSGHYVIATARSKEGLEKVISSCLHPENVKISISDLEKLIASKDKSLEDDYEKTAADPAFFDRYQKDKKDLQQAMKDWEKVSLDLELF